MLLVVVVDQNKTATLEVDMVVVDDVDCQTEQDPTRIPTVDLVEVEVPQEKLVLMVVMAVVES